MVRYQFLKQTCLGCNFFVNDILTRLVNKIQPIFDNVQLNSSKNFQFQAFSKAVNLFNQKAHLTREGKMTIMDLFCQLALSYKP